MKVVVHNTIIHQYELSRLCYIHIFI